MLGDHVNQAGSLVEPDRVRFDFTHFSAMSAEELTKVSKIVNRAILAGYDVQTEEMPIAQARERGAIALFGEKYGDIVRVVDMGGGFSVELCGGTHLDNTAKVGVFHIDSEFSVASGVRRIEASTGIVTLQTIERNQEMLFEAAAVLKAKPAALRERVGQTLEELRELRRAVEQFKAREASGEADRILFGAHDVKGLRVVTAALRDADGAALRQMGDTLRGKDPTVVAVLAGTKDGKISFSVSCGSEAVARGIKAGDLIRAVCAACGGKGGGKPESAMGGGTDPLKVDDALAQVDDFVSGKLG